MTHKKLQVEAVKHLEAFLDSYGIGWREVFAYDYVGAIQELLHNQRESYNVKIGSYNTDWSNSSKHYRKVTFHPAQSTKTTGQPTVEEFQVINLIADVFGFNVHELTLSDDLKTNLYLDELDIVQLAMVLEDHYGTEISDEKIDSCTTIKDVTGLVAGLKDRYA